MGRGSLAGGGPKAGNGSQLVTNSAKTRCALPKERILRGSKNLEHLFGSGSFHRGRLFDVVYLETGASLKIAFAAVRRIRRAIDRNRIKRRLREAYRLEVKTCSMRGNAILIGNEKTLSCSMKTLRSEVARVFRNLERVVRKP